MSADEIVSPGVTVVLPCLDEADAVGACVTEALEAMTAAGIDGEVVVVDNGSTDRSPELAENAGARVIHESVRGYGAALRAGFSAAEGDVVVMADADLTYPLDRIPDLVAPVIDGSADLVLGSRLDSATRQSMPFLHRHLGTPVLTFLTARACGRRVTTDSQSGFRAFRRDSLGLLDLRSSGMELASEMLIRAEREGLEIVEIPTGYRPRVGESKLSTWSDGWRHLQLILLLAPDLLLILPGLVVTGIGLVMLGMAFVQPEGIEVGSSQWQPVFFSGIALVLGVQAVLAGIVLAHNSSVVGAGTHLRYSFVGDQRFSVRCVLTGLAMLGVGLALNLGMFLQWLESNSPDGRSFGVASLSQSLIILGGTFASFGIVSRFLPIAGEDSSPRP